MFGIRFCHIAVVVAIAFALTSQAQEILVAQVAPFTGLPGPGAADIRDGANSYFDFSNQEGGVRGRKISMFSIDDGFRGDVFAHQFKEAMRRNPVALLSPIGSEALTTLNRDGLLDSTDIVVVNAIPGSETFRSPGHPRLFHLRAGDKAQFEKILLHCKTVGIKDVHILSEDLPGSRSSVGVSVSAAQAIGGIAVGTTVVTHTQTTLSVAAKKISALRPQGIVVNGTPRFMAEAVDQLRKAGAHQSIFALSYLPVSLAIQVAGVNSARGLGIAQTFPNPNGRHLKIQRDFQDTMRKFKPEVKEYTTFHLEGYVAARVIVAGLRRADGPLNPSGLAKGLKDMGEMDLGGFRLNFSRGNVGGEWTDIGVVSSSGSLVY